MTDPGSNSEIPNNGNATVHLTDVDLTTAKKERGNLKRKLTNLEKFLDSYNPTKYHSLVRQSKDFEGNLCDFEKWQTIIEKGGSGTLNEDGIDEDARNDFENRYFALYDKMFSILTPINTEVSPSSATPSNVENGIHSQITNPLINPLNTSSSNNEISDDFKMPSLGLPSFNGNYESWLGFYDVFYSMVHNNSKLAPILKLRYLKNCLTGEAAEVIASVQLSGENYLVAWESLKETYDNRKLIKQNHIQDLLNVPYMSKEFSLRELLNHVQKHIRALKVLEEPVDQWGSLLIVLIRSRMDSNTAERWDEFSCENVCPGLDELISFLQKRAQLDATRSAQIRNKHNISHERKPQSNSRPNNNNRSNQKLFLSKTSPTSCQNCKGQHDLISCDSFLNLSPSDRFKIVKRENLCVNCLQSSHRTNKCTGEPCAKCQKKHNILLHFENKGLIENDSNICKSTNLNYLPSNNNSSEMLLSTVVVELVSQENKIKQCRFLLDSGSQSHYITESVATHLNLPRSPVNINVLSIGTNYTTVRHSTNAVIKSRFSDPEFEQSGNLDGIIGVGLFYNLLCVGQIRLKNHPAILQKTLLGWIIAGEIYGKSVSSTQTRQCNFTRNSSIESQLTKFWEVEELPNSKIRSPEEIACEEHFAKNTIRDSDGSYIVRLPFNDKREQIGNSFNTTLRRFFSLENRFRKDPDLEKSCKEQIEEYELLNHMTLVPDDQLNHSSGFYLPYHAVIKEESLTTRSRLVFDASTEPPTGVSLNEALMVGPTIQPDLFSHLIRFRSRQFVLTADIVKMYRQIKMHPDDTSFQKIIYRESPDKPIKIYSLNRVTFGVASAPFLATRVLHQLADDECLQYPLASEVLKNDFYVDDLMTGTNTKKEAVELRDDLIELLKKGGFCLRKWASNDPSIVSDLENSRDNPFMALDSSDSVKTLGVHWNFKEDTISYTVKLPESNSKTTKRKIISQVAKIFDPYGLLGPVIIPGKIMLQELWKLNIHWDETIPTSIETSWREYLDQLPCINQLRFQRCAISPNAKNLQLHGFCDSSEKAYGACLYIRSIDERGQAQVVLLCSKSRVAPVKTISLPRLELCSALLLAELQNLVQNTLKINFDHTYFWSDSTITLHWINTQPHLLKTFVANRVAKIQTLTDIRHWKHVPTSENPADLISRGQWPKEFAKDTLWSNGPQYLLLSENHWPSLELKNESIPEMKIQKPVQMVMNIIVSGRNILEKFSSFRTLVRVIAYCLRFAHNAKGKDKQIDELTKDELNLSLNRIVRLTQKRDFSKEISALSREEEIDSKSPIKSLNPFLDEGIIRVGGRLEHSNLKPEQKHPILLPRNHHVTTLIVREEHVKLLHAGIQTTLYSVRELYWPIDGRNTTRKIIHQCMPCFRAKPRDINYVMGNLPAKRVEFVRPFLHTGVDYCGPFFIKEKRLRNRGKVKCYVAIFVCLACKAVHLEVVNDLTTESFLEALSRFISRRGKPISLMSDNATNFKGADRELKELQELLQSEKHNEDIKKFLNDSKIMWSFIPPRAPHFGGLWEAGVKSFKHHFLRSVGDTLLTYDQLETYAIEIKAVLNSRPLSPLSSDPNDHRPLTPGHFLIGEPLTSLPQADFRNTPINRLSAWQHSQLLRRHFWTRWHKEYLNELNTRTKWKNANKNITIGTLVVLKEDNTPPLHWVLGRVIETHPGQDGVVRVVTVKTEASTYKRSVKNICPLPNEQNIENAVS
ncbi:uncharacterized protein LOC122504323 [Leptopilina heterotoma]|uniref:uncharacterized protein LOC122504323 n=1 Tax=Leptopilina heterotoma TaxID=63436 RepID=UPI001CA8871E|nr:uncharacterized protein LOC122504323 [Leptopilina heterotoma]